MTALLNISRILTLSQETSNKNLLFDTESALESLSYTPKEIQLVLAFHTEDAAENFLHSDVKLSIFVGSTHNQIFRQEVCTVTNSQKSRNIFNINFNVNESPDAAIFSVLKTCPPNPVYFMFTFPSGKPTYIANSFVMVTGKTLPVEKIYPKFTN